MRLDPRRFPLSDNGDLGLVGFSVTLVPEVVFIALLGHGHGHDKEQAHQPRGGRYRRVLWIMAIIEETSLLYTTTNLEDHGQDQGAEKVKVGSTSKLLKEIQGDKGEQRILGRVSSVARELDLNLLLIHLLHHDVGHLCQE